MTDFETFLLDYGDDLVFTINRKNCTEMAFFNCLVKNAIELPNNDVLLTCNQVVIKGKDYTIDDKITIYMLLSEITFYTQSKKDFFGKQEINEGEEDVKENKKYWYIQANGSIEQNINCKTSFDKDLIKFGNTFRTKYEAEFIKNKLKYTSMYKNYIKKHSKPLDWNNMESDKYCAVYDYEDSTINIDCTTYYKVPGAIYASSDKIIKDAIEFIEENNFKKYILGIEEE